VAQEENPLKSIIFGVNNKLLSLAVYVEGDRYEVLPLV
jgi:hypothetical protein